MAEEILDKVRDYLDGIIDFKGQALAESLTTYLLIATGVAAFLAGYTTQDIALTLWVGLAGTALVLLAVVPPWPWFNRNPVPWLQGASGPGPGGITVEVDGKKVS